MERSITSKTISQQTICGEIERPDKDWVFPEIAKEVPWACNKDKDKDKEFEQTRTDFNKAREVYFDLIKMQSMA